MQRVLNMSAYRFVAIDDAAGLRDAIAALANRLGLKGSVLIAAEGINLFLAGAPAAVREFVAWLQAHRRFTGLQTTESGSADVPFGRLQVQVKREIIRMNEPAVRPAAGRAPAIGAATLAAWLDRGCDDGGRPLLLLDTRNTFEVEQGRFRGAVDWRLDKFGDFPRAARSHRASLAGRTVVTYCTGGIRCEKAAVFLAQAGVPDVLQLHGGILGYFQTVGERHFDGSCFVFDRRGAIEPGRPAAASNSSMPCPA